MIALTIFENGYCQIPPLQQVQLDKQPEVGQQSITGEKRPPFGELFGTEVGKKPTGTGEQKSLSEQTWKEQLIGESSGKRSDKFGGNLPTGTDMQQSFAQQQLFNAISARGAPQQGTSRIEAQEALGEISRAFGAVQQPFDQIYGAGTQQRGLGHSTTEAQQLGLQPFGQPMQQLLNSIYGIGTEQLTGQQQQPFGPFGTGVQQASVFGTPTSGLGVPSVGAQQLSIGPFGQQEQKLFNELFGTGTDQRTGESLTLLHQPQFANFGSSSTGVQQPLIQTYGSEMQRSGFGGPTQGTPFGQQEQLGLNELLGIDQLTGESSPTRQQQLQFGSSGTGVLQPFVQTYGSVIQQPGLAAPSVGSQQLGNEPFGTASQQMLNEVFGIGGDQQFPTGEKQPQLALSGIGMQQPQQFGEQFGRARYQPSVNTNQLPLVGSKAMDPNKQGKWVNRGNEEMPNKQPLDMFGQVSNIQPIQQIPNNQGRMRPTLEPW